MGRSKFGVRAVAVLAVAVALAVVAYLVPGGRAMRASKHSQHGQHPQPEGQHALVQLWAKRLGEQLTDFANSITRFHRLHDSYKNAKVVVRNGTATLEAVVRSVQDLTQIRAQQVQEIRKQAEALGRAEFYSIPIEGWHHYLGVKDWETTEAPTPPPTKKPRRRARTTRAPPTTAMPPTPPPTTLKPWLIHMDAFAGGQLVNESISAVHVPATVDDGTFTDAGPTMDPDTLEMWLQGPGANVQRVIELTAKLDEVFVKNAERDRTTSWQFFAHPNGVMRQFPASKWGREYHMDYYDARLRPWYTGASMSPKDVVILLDNSGSIRMTEQALLTKLVVHTILDTLSPDDFVSVLLFNESTTPLFPGLNETLIPATPAHVRTLQYALEEVSPKGAANLSKALESAFILLEKYRQRALGAACNQAVMLVTDLVPEHEEELFKTYNRPELEDNPGQTNARVFTFIVVHPTQRDLREAEWMACANMGFHMKIWESGTEKVISYMPVFSRPIVLGGMHPVHWTHMYPDITVPGYGDLLWAEMQKDEQLRKVTPFCFKHAEMHPLAKKHNVGHLPIVDKALGQDEEYVITVSVPVRNLTTAGIVNGDILGVAGIDVPIKQITRMIPHHKLGVNGYIFMVSNNGLVLFHPELRPRFNGILKPGFNSIDMTELEQEDVVFPRNMSDSMREFRELVINQTTGTVVLAIKQVYENWHRVSRWNRRYFFQGVQDTPYSLVLAFPEDYGAYRIEPPSSSPTPDKLYSLLGATRWTVHPHWVYCACCGAPGLQGLRQLAQGFLGPSQGPTSSRGGCVRCKGAVTGGCADQSLASGLAHDAELTKWWATEELRDLSKWKHVSVAFVATHSGLTRWLSPPKNTVIRDESHLGAVDWQRDARGPDEVWYRRAVESATTFPREASSSTSSSASLDAPLWVVSVPLVDKPDADVYSEYNAAYDPEDPWAARRAGLADQWQGMPPVNLTYEERLDAVGFQHVTMSAAVFRKRAPAAAAGLRFPQRKLQDLFKGIVDTLSCPGPTVCGETCASDFLDCYLVDEHAIVVADKTGLEAGRPLALVNKDLMVRLEAADVFQRFTVYDYQGVCRRGPASSAEPLVPPSATCWAGVALATLWWQRQGLGLGRGLAPAAALLLGSANGILGKLGEDDLEADDLGAVTRLKEASTTPEYRQALRMALAPYRVNKTVLHLCDMKMDRHRVGPGLHRVHRQPLSCDGRSFAAAVVPGTNLVLVTALRNCSSLDQFEPFDTEPGEDVPPEGSPVFRKEGLLWPRRPPAACYRKHVGERNITQCSGAPRLHSILAPLVALPLLVGLAGVVGA